MLTQPTIDKLNAMKLAAMARALAERLNGLPGIAVRVRHRDLGRE